jgi:hypothetical protein
MNPKLFEAARREMYGNVIRRFDGAESVCSMLSDATILGYDLFEHIELIKNITLKDLEEVLPVLSKEKAVLSVVRAKTEG